MADNSQEDTAGCITAVRFVLFILYLGFTFHTQVWFWIIVIILVILLIFAAICFSNDEEDNSSNSSTQISNSSSNNQPNNTQSSTNTSPQNIQWTEVGTYYSNNSQTSEHNQNISFDNDFFSGNNQKINISDLLTNLVGQKDRVSGEILQPGEKIYVCESCQLGYHQDSWEFLNKECEQCNFSISKLYTLPFNITFKDIPQTQSFNSAEDLLNSGLQKNENENYDEAIKDFSEALRLHSNFAESYYHRGIAHYELDSFKAAIKDFTQAIKINPNYDVAYNQRGLAYQEVNEMQLAIENYTQALNINPRLADAYSNRGYAYYNLNNMSAAIKDYNKALNLETCSFMLMLIKKDLEVAQSKLEEQQRNNNSVNINKISSSSTQICETYISVLDLEVIHTNNVKSVNLKGKIIWVNENTEYNLIYFRFGKDISDSLYAYIFKNSF